MTERRLKCSKEEDEYLKKEPKYTLNKKLNLKEVILKIERVLKLIPQEEATRIRNLTQDSWFGTCRWDG